LGNSASRIQYDGICAYLIVFEYSITQSYECNDWCKSLDTNVESCRISTESSRDLILSPLDRSKCLLSNVFFEKSF
jgi:hypothetical protein